MSWSLHWSEVAVLDANAAALGVPEWELMQSAGSQLAEQAGAMLVAERDSAGDASSVPAGRVLVLCGPGNNGGDGFVAAAMMAGGEGVDVSIISSHEASKSDIAVKARMLAERADVGIEVWKGPDSVSWTEPDLVIDALLGVGPIGPGEPLRGNVAELAEWTRLALKRNDSAARVLACDVPTGFGTPSCLAADHTVSFHSAKLGMLDEEGAVGEGIGVLSIAELPWPAETLDPGPGDLLRFPPLDTEAVKGERGRLLVVGGGPYHGAPLLAAMAAMRVGCDLVHVAMPQAAASRARWPVDVIPESIPDQGTFSRGSLSVLAERMDAGRGVQAVLVGPGLGRLDTTLDAVRGLLELCIERDIPAVVDADAISALPKGGWPTGLLGIATPHATELEHWMAHTPLTEIVDHAVKESRWDPTSADVENICVVRTGPVDELFSPCGRNCSISGGHPRMSVGGTGDLLAGMAAGLLAGGMSPWPAARCAVWLLRRAGEKAGDEFGPGLVARDVPEHIARVLSELI